MRNDPYLQPPIEVRASAVSLGNQGRTDLALGQRPFHGNFGYGTTGTLLSGGSIPLLNWASAIAVSVALVTLFAEFLETYIVPLEPEDAGS